METCGLIDSIDWSAPWLAHVADGRGLLTEPDWRGALSRAARAGGVCSGGGQVVEFVDGNDAPSGTAYEAHIAATGRVPTRDNLHDRFNALMWLTFPKLKAALNRRQAAEIARLGVGDRRGPVRDAATLIDENALLLACDDTLLFEMLAQRRWHEALVERRAQWHRTIMPFAFGHAMLDKLTRPFKGITAAVLPLPLGDGSIAAIDASAAQFVVDPQLAPSMLGNLPVLGIPGWCAANEDAAFYDDLQVFRPVSPMRRVA